MSSGFVSVVVPTFNRADCLATAIDSILAQTHRDLEILLVDDGSTDDTRAMVCSLWVDEPRVRYLHQRNRGVSAARNLGLRNARGEYLALLDSDDTWMPWKLEAQLACLAEFPDAGMVWTDMQAVNVDDQVIDPMHLRTFYSAYRWFAPEELFSVARPVVSFMRAAPEALSGAVVRFGDIFSPMIMGNLVHTSTVLLRRARFEQVLGFDETMHTGEDYDFHLRTCRAGPVAFLDAAAIRYRCGRGDRLTRPELSLEIGRNFLRTVEPVIEHDRPRISLPDWMIAASRAEGHRWVGESALSVGRLTEARVHLAASLRLDPWQARTALLLASSLAPQAATQALRRGLRHLKRAMRSKTAGGT